MSNNIFKTEIFTDHCNICCTVLNCVCFNGFHATNVVDKHLLKPDHVTLCICPSHLRMTQSGACDLSWCAVQLNLMAAVWPWRPWRLSQDTHPDLKDDSLPIMHHSHWPDTSTRSICHCPGPRSVRCAWPCCRGCSRRCSCARADSDSHIHRPGWNTRCRWRRCCGPSDTRRCLEEEEVRLCVNMLSAWELCVCVFGQLYLYRTLRLQWTPRCHGNPHDTRSDTNQVSSHRWRVCHTAPNPPSTRRYLNTHTGHYL